MMKRTKKIIDIIARYGKLGFDVADERADKIYMVDKNSFWVTLFKNGTLKNGKK